MECGHTYPTTHLPHYFRHNYPSKKFKKYPDIPTPVPIFFPTYLPQWNFFPNEKNLPNTSMKISNDLKVKVFKVVFLAVALMTMAVYGQGLIDRTSTNGNPSRSHEQSASHYLWNNKLYSQCGRPAKFSYPRKLGCRLQRIKLYKTNHMFDW